MWQEILTYILTFIFGGGLLSALTFGITRKKMAAEAKQAVAEVDLKYANVIQKHLDMEKQLTEQLAELEQKHEAVVEAKGEEIKDLTKALYESKNEAATKGYFMCVHQGCIVRCPSFGQGKIYYDQHKAETGFGADYLPIEELVARYKRTPPKEATLARIKDYETEQD